MTHRTVEFEVLDEPWNIYALSDGSTLRVRFLLLKAVEAETKSGPRPGITPDLILVSDSPAELRGPPGRPPQLGEIEGHLDPEKIVARPVRVAPAHYRLSTGHRLTVEVAIIQVQRSRLYGPDGEPFYHVTTDIRTIVVPPGPGDSHLLDQPLRTDA